MKNPFPARSDQARIFALTSRFIPGASAGAPQKDKSQGDPRVRAVEAALKRTRDPDARQRMARLAGLFLEGAANLLATTSPEEDSLYRSGMAVIPTRNANSHDYALGEVCFVFALVNHDEALKLDGSKGNHLPGDGPDPAEGVRLAKVEELKDAIAALTPKAAARIADALDFAVAYEEVNGPASPRRRGPGGRGGRRLRPPPATEAPRTLTLGPGAVADSAAAPGATPGAEPTLV